MLSSNCNLRNIEKEELREFFQLGFSSEDAHLVDQMMNEGDEDKDNLISFLEFKKILNIFYGKLQK